MEPVVSSTPHYGHGIRLLSHSRYGVPTTVHRRPTDSSDKPSCSALGWHLIVQDFATFVTSPYRQKSQCDLSVQCCLEPVSSGSLINSSIKVYIDLIMIAPRLVFPQ